MIRFMPSVGWYAFRSYGSPERVNFCSIASPDLSLVLITGIWRLYESPGLTLIFFSVVGAIQRIALSPNMSLSSQLSPSMPQLPRCGNLISSIKVLGLESRPSSECVYVATPVWVHFRPTRISVNGRRLIVGRFIVNLSSLLASTMPSEDRIDPESAFLRFCQINRLIMVIEIIKASRVAPIIPATKSALEEAGPKTR